MDIRQNLTNVNCNPRGTNPQWIVIHNTANGTSAAGTAYNNTVYFKDVYREASAHYFVDDGNIIWQCVRDTDTAWHVGEAPSRNGCYNYNAIGIEVCETADGWFTEKEIATLQELVPYLMAKYGIPAERVCRHHDVTGKYCPYWYTDYSRWIALKNRILEGDDIVTPADKKEIAQMVWEYVYMYGTPEQDQTLARCGFGGNSNGYNVIRSNIIQTCENAKKLEEIENKLDKIVKLLG